MNQELTEKMKDIISTGFGIGNNAIKEAVEAATSAESLSDELNQLRYAAIFVLSSLIFNEEKEFPGTIEETLNHHFLIVRQTVDDLKAKFSNGDLIVKEVPSVSAPL